MLTRSPNLFQDDPLWSARYHVFLSNIILKLYAIFIFIPTHSLKNMKKIHILLLCYVIDLYVIIGNMNDEHQESSKT